MKKHLLLIFLFISLFLIPASVFAQSNYVLPYPSSMPGTFLYKLRIVTEPLLRLWYFGGLARFKYDLKESDKYLVEAKTLFEYKQYLLAENSLKKSDEYFLNAKKDLEIAKQRKKINEQGTILQQALEKHIEVLEGLKQITPEQFLWQPEKSTATKLNIWQTIDTSIKIRQI